MKLGLACLACRAPCMHLFMTMLAATASVAVATSSSLASPLLEQLPQTLRFALVAKRHGARHKKSHLQYAKAELKLLPPYYSDAD